jgi:hypothetical protein
MGHHRDAGAGEGVDLRGDARPALQLDGVRAALLHEAERRGERLLGAGLVAAEREVGHDERALRTPHHGLDQRQQLVDRDRERVLVPVDVVGG